MSEMFNVKESRFLIGLSASIIIHILLFLTFQYLITFNFEKSKEFRGAITVTLQKVVPEEGTVKQTNVKNSIIKSQGGKTKNLKANTKKSLSAQKPSEQPMQKLEAKKYYLEQQTKPEQIIKTNKISNNKPEKPLQSYTESSPGKVSSRLQRGEVKTLSKEKGIVPVIPQGIKEKKKKEKPLPFQPGATVEQAPLAFNLGELKSQYEGSITKKETGEKTGETTQKNVSITGQSVKSNSLIEWEKGAQKRKVISMGPKPRLPDWVKKEGLQLKVTLIFKVTPDGYVTDLKVFQSSGFSDVDAAIMESVRKIVFEPVHSNKSDIAKITYIIEPR